MHGSEVAIAWIVLCPIAFLTNVIILLVVQHYRPLLHSCDVAFTSLLVTMAANAMLLLPVQSVTELASIPWGVELCTFYVWLSLTLRASHLLVLLVLNVYWVASLRVTVKGHMFTSSKHVKFLVTICWIIAVIIGIIPATGGIKIFQFYDSETCKFLPTDVSLGFGVVFIIMALVSFVMGIISSADSRQLFKHMHQVALRKYNAGRFHLPTVSGNVQTSSPVHAKYSELNVARELCSLVFYVTLMSSCLNSIPLFVSQFVQIVQEHDRVVMETVLLWLLLAEALVLPHFLWLMSKRYRHAAVYTWRVFVLRDKGAREEDAAACSLQSYRFVNGNMNIRSQTNGVGQANGHATRGSPHDHQELEDSLEYHQTTNGNGRSLQTPGQAQYIMTTDLDDGMTVVTQLTSGDPRANGQGHVAMNNLDPAEPTVRKAPPKKSPRTNIPVSNKTPDSSKQPETVSPAAGSGSEVSRSTSTRQEWKERMRKKYLPTLFVDEHPTQPDAGEVDLSDVEYVQSGDAVLETHAGHVTRLPTTASVDSTYYMSSDYHYNYLSESIPPRLKHSATYESEADDDLYESRDIGDILDKSGQLESYGFETHNLDNKFPEVSLDQSFPETEVQNTQEEKGKLNNQANVDVIGLYFEDSTPDILEESVSHAIKPEIRRDNYRKFLSITNLQISSVDVDEDMDHVPKTEPITTQRFNISEEDSVTSTARLGGRVPQEESKPQMVGEVDSKVSAIGQDSEMLAIVQDSEVSEVVQEENEVSSVIAESNLQDSKLQAVVQDSELQALVQDSELQAVVQEYDEMQTVSGSEMLRLKIQSRRVAAAMESTDETSSSEDDFDSNTASLEEIAPSKVSGRESHVDQIIPTNVAVTESNNDLYSEIESEERRSENFVHRQQYRFSNSPDLNKTYDGNSSQYLNKDNINETSHNLNRSNMNKNNRSDVFTYKTSPKSVRNPNLKNIVTNPFLRESFEVASERSQASNKSQLQTNPFLTESFDEVAHNSQQLNPFLKSDEVFAFGPVLNDQNTTTGGKTLNNGVLSKPFPGRRSARHTSSEDELNSIFSDSSMDSHRSESFDSISSLDNVIDSQHEIDDAKMSVTFEPYGERHPAWMENSISATSPRTDDSGSKFRITISDEVSNDVVEYDLDSVNIGVQSPISNQGMNRSQYLTNTPNLVQYRFDDDIERGFEAALAADYLVHSNLYTGICFEAIQEETEDSESLASLDEAENVFKTHAVMSRPSSRASVVGWAEEKGSKNNEFLDSFNDIQDTTWSFPERTSADGSDDVTTGQTASCTQGRPVSDPWGFNARSYPADDQQSTDSLDDIELADDIVTSLPSHLKQTEFTPWAQGPVRSPSLDLNFDSDFSLEDYSETSRPFTPDVTDAKLPSAYF
ncbi:uncharacterized protein LOC131955513 [Physella acuta]|uniref:uncharacterized protein LOC131955513 n=1 Tax=Physella acuta TaxID=109671 RepID=UPI0027DDF30D|nr:uncharacterized protein LOC131955513 [Physella acuta]